MVAKHELAFTGGTFSMGYVTGAFLKRLSEEYAGLQDQEYYLYPLYDIRHVALAARIDASRTLLPDRKNQLYAELVETHTIIEHELLAGPEHAFDFKKQLNDTLNAIAGKIEPGHTVDDALKAYGLTQDSVVTPYFIDSINYDEEQHDEKLYTAARHALLNKKRETFFVIGGTDTLNLYAGKLTRRLIDEGIISEANGNKIIFLSAMKSFGYGPEGIRETPESVLQEYQEAQGIPIAFQRPVKPPADPHIIIHPQHVGRLFRMAMALAESSSADSGKALPPGGYILSAYEDGANAAIVHDARECQKIYSKSADAFRSKTRAGTIYPDGEFELNPQYHTTFAATGSPQEKVPHVEIAPPLISGNSTGAVLNYLQKMHDYPVMIIGGIPTLGTPPDLASAWGHDAIDTVKPATPAIPLNIEEARKVAIATLDVIRERAERGIATYFVNPDVYDINNPNIYDINHDSVHPMIPMDIWQNNRMIEEVKKAGGIVVSGSTIAGLYHDIQRQLGKIAAVQGSEKIRRAGGTIERKLNKDLSHTHIPMMEGDPIGIEYIPDTKAFEAGFKAAASLSDKVVLSVLPGGVVPSRVAPLVASYPGKEFYAGYRYGHERRRWLQQIQRPERERFPDYFVPRAQSVPVSTYAPAQAFANAGGRSIGDFSPAEALADLQRMAGLDPVSLTMSDMLGRRVGRGSPHFRGP